MRWIVAALALCACSLDLPTAPLASPCGSFGERCCVLDGGTAACRGSLVCATSRDLDAGAAGLCVSCPSGLVACRGACVDLSSEEHCGACETRCAAGEVCARNAGDAGVAWTCVRAACPEGQTFCDGVGCVDLTRDSAHCGTCERACDGTATGTVQRCVAGVCRVAACVPGRADCGGTDDCETDLATSVTHCGACGQTCGAANVARATCAAGRCAIGECRVGFADCDRAAVNGCEADLQSDATNCGACGRVCTAASGLTAVCVAGVCAQRGVCGASLGDCDGNPTNGCERDLTTDARNCGACGRACNATNGTPVCSGGACVAILCDAGFANCDGNLGTGCEVPLNTDATNCGACGRACDLPNATEACAAGACVITSCLAGWGNCDGVASNGCETSLTNNNTACGACGRVCVQPQTCSGSSCACPSGSTLCAGACVNTSFDNANCGACVRACASGTRCAMGSCVATCPTGTTDCATANAGCVDTTSSVSHCGACGRVCNGTGGTPNCVGGACRIACAAGFGNCNSSVSDGCETNLTTAAQCGACGASCVDAPNATGCAGSRCACVAGRYDCNASRSDGCESTTPCPAP